MGGSFARVPEARDRRGELRVYLGAAPGVGKTFAMLGEGRRRRDRGTDVVVGFVETHGRARTAEEIGDLEVVPRHRVEYRGTSFEEMDVDAELLARVRAALRRAVPADEAPVVATDDFRIDFAAKQVTASDDTVVRLTPTEWHLVEVLARHAGKLVPSRQLLQEVWGPAYGQETNYLRVHMAHVRQKLEPVPSRPRYFITEPGMGYRFVAADVSEVSDG